MNLLPISSDSYKFISWLSTSGKARTTTVSVLLGKAIADEEVMPVEGVADFDVFYVNSKLLSIKELISNILEMCLIDYTEVERYARSFFAWRVKIATSPAFYTPGDKDSILEDILGICNYLDKASLCSITENADDTAYILNSARIAIRDIKKASMDNAWMGGV